MGWVLLFNRRQKMDREAETKPENETDKQENEPNE